MNNVYLYIKKNIINYYIWVFCELKWLKFGLLEGKVCYISKDMYL